MGEVYLAEHKYIARRAAIKFLLKELTSSEEVFNRFFTEARAASLIQHPAIIEVQDCGVHTDGRAYMIMEFLNGESVRGYLERTGKMERDRDGALAISRQVAGALGAAHEQGIVHRDMKPDNIFLHLPSGRPPSDPLVKVLDFGIAKLMGGSAAGTKTRTGNLLGTPLYMSPEQCRGSGQIDNRSDVYSLGCIMYELFCGTPPFVAEGLGDLIVAHVATPPPDPPGVTPAVRAILLACLTKDPNKRPQSMAELGRMLAEAGAAEIVRLKKPVAPSVPAGPGPNSGINSPVGLRAPAFSATPPPTNIGLAPAPVPSAPALMKAQPTPVTSPGTRGGTVPWPSAAPPETTLGRTAGEVVDFEAPARSKNGKLVIGGIAVAAVALVAFLVLGRGSGDKPGADTASAPAPAPTPAATAAAPPVAAPPPPPAAPKPPATARIELAGLPPGAGVQLDGRPAEPPFKLPRGTDKHRVTVTAEGFDPLELSVDGSKDQTLTVALKKAAPAADKPTGKPHHKSERKHGGFSGFNDL